MGQVFLDLGQEYMRFKLNDVTIYEKNRMPGGECTGWNRQGYHIDNCIHFLVGCNKGEKLQSLWTNIGALNDDIKLYRERYFYGLEMDNVKLYLWRDLERTRKELLDVAKKSNDMIFHSGIAFPS